MASRLAKGQFDMNDLRGQLQQMSRMGGLGALAGMIPGMKKAQQAMASGAVSDKVLVHMDAMIGSMTVKERGKPELINAKRKIRIAKGVGHDGAGGQQAPEDAPGNVDRDEEDQEDGRPEGHDGDARQGRAWAGAWPGSAMRSAASSSAT